MSSAVRGTRSAVRYSQAYTYGNAARQLEQNREAEERRLRRLEARRYERAVRRRQEKALRMDLPYLMLLTVATIVTLFICCSYIRVQSSIAASMRCMRSIETKEKQLESMKSENDALQTAINTDIDLDHIYEIATTELGMVYADRNQVIRYKKTESEYVRQYEDIPGEN